MRIDQRPSQSTLGYIPEGPPGIAATLKIMSRLVREGKKSMVVRDHVVKLIRAEGLAQKDWIGEIRVLHRFVRDDVRYLMDPTDVELVQDPECTLRLRVGDCDDKSTLLCAMLESIGHPTRFLAIGFEPGIYEHVLLETKIGEQWITCETTEPVEIGWRPPSGLIRARMIHHN